VPTLAAATLMSELQALENIAKLKKENRCMLAALNSTVHLV
jgi:hypothetical protein